MKIECLQKQGIISWQHRKEKCGVVTRNLRFNWVGVMRRCKGYTEMHDSRRWSKLWTGHVLQIERPRTSRKLLEWVEYYHKKKGKIAVKRWSSEVEENIRLIDNKQKEKLKDRWHYCTCILVVLEIGIVDRYLVLYITRLYCFFRTSF